MSTYHTGRLIDHLHLITLDLAASRRFYAAVFAVLGRAIKDDDDHRFSSDEFNVSTPEDVTVGKTHIHLAFQANSRAMVDRFHAAGLAAGGRDNGAPGDRDYHPCYYGAFLLDPDGNNVEAVWHGPSERSIDMVTVTQGLC